jgi:proteasome accessory factor C
MLPWLMERGEAPVAEMAERFGLSEDELVADLELASVCGLPPFVDEMIDVFIDEGMVFTGVPRVFTRPLRLTAPEGFSLLAAGRAAMELPGADPGGALARALDKLARVLGDEAAGLGSGDDATGVRPGVDQVVIDLPRPPATDDVTAAVADSARLHISYWTPSRDEMSEREITPRAVFADGGHWYTVADDHRSGEERVFRVDRIEEWSRTGLVDVPRTVAIPAAGSWFADDPDLTVATLRLQPQARWMAERYPMRSVTEAADGSTVVELAVANERWLGRLLVRLGPDATLVEPAELHDLAAGAAAAMLERYEAAAS